MPTRPVTWDLDVPPASLLESSKKKTPPASQVPRLDKLRISLMGTRFELLKISTFSAFLLAFVGVAIHGSHLANPDNQFAANARSAIKGLVEAVSNRTASLCGRIEALALAAVHDAQAVVGHATAVTATPPSPSMIAKADMPAVKHAPHVARVHHKAHALQPDAASQPHADGAALRNPSSMLKSLLSPDSLVAGIAALLLYMIFVVVLVRIKGGLRALGGSHAV